MPPGLRAAIPTGLASLAVALAALVTAGSGPALADSTPSVHAGPAGGIVKPSASGSAARGGSLRAAEVYGGSASSGGSPGGGTPPLLYKGGPVMHGVTTQVIAWAPSADPFPSGYVSGYEHYLADMSTDLGLSSNISSVAGQYIDASGAALSSLTNNAAITDTDPYPSSGCSVSGTSVCLTESQILTELSSVIEADALAVDVDHSYIVLLPPSIDTCFDSSSSQCETQAFCGYHSALSIGGAITTFTLLPYTESTYSNSGRGQCYVSGGPAGLDPAVNAVDSVGAHELFESATDPLVGSGYIDSVGEEIGDECAWTWGSYSSATGGGVYNQSVNGDQYLIQEMWSNQANACEQGASSTARATISPAASPVLNTATGFSVALSGDSSAASSYEWSYMAPDGTSSTDVSTAASPSLTFSSTGTYTVWVQVTDAAGGTVTAVRDVTVTTAAAPSASFGYSSQTSVPATGSAVSFTSTSAPSSAQSITTSSWTFGDGSTASGSAVSHTYGSPGTYTVTLQVTQSNGQFDSTAHTVTVVNPPAAAISWDSSAPTAGVALTLSPGASAGAGAITAYSWDFGDGDSSTTAGPSHTYVSAGSYPVTLTVTQTDGLQATVTRTITVAAAPAPPSSDGSGGSTGGNGSTGSTTSAGSTSGGSTTSGNTTTTGSAASPGSAAASSWPELTTWLVQAIQHSGATRIGALLRSRGVRVTLSAPQVAGRLTLTWNATVHHRTIVIASGSRSLSAGVGAPVTVKLTRAGRSLLAKQHRLRISVRALFSAPSGSASVSRSLTLSR